jgi:hypothetical protein
MRGNTKAKQKTADIDSVANAPHHQYWHAPGRQDAGQGKLVKCSTSI